MHGNRRITPWMLASVPIVFILAASNLPTLRLHPVQSLPHRSPLPQIPSSPRALLRRLQKEALTPIRGPTIPIFFFSLLHFVVKFLNGFILPARSRMASRSELTLCAALFLLCCPSRVFAEEKCHWHWLRPQRSDLLEVLHRFYPNAMPLTEKLSAPASQQALRPQASLSQARALNPPIRRRSLHSSAPMASALSLFPRILTVPKSLSMTNSSATPRHSKASLVSHAVLLKFPGHAYWRRTLEILKSSKVSLKATLEPIS